MKKVIPLIWLCLVGLYTLVAQNPEKPRLITGPVIGTVTATTAKIWYAYRGDGSNMLTLCDTSEPAIFRPTRFEKINDAKGNFVQNVTFEGLVPGHTYRVTYALEPFFPHPKCLVTTLADTPVHDFNFLVGSCAYLSPGFARIVFPGNAIRIFYYMKRKQSNFMVWLGDNVYYMFKDYRNYQNMFDRQLKIRNKFFLLGDFLNGQPNYATWDDHDYGWNNADSTFPGKNDAVKVFKGFWPNDFEHGDTAAGIYYSFRQYDSEFFMTDNRWYLQPQGDTGGSFLGQQQLKWLQESLKKSDATFKFVCIGSQVISDAWIDDSYAKYPVERNQLLDFIIENNIPGVIFLTGDKHMTELSKLDWKGYPFYDFTCSPLTAPIVPTKNLPGYVNHYSVKKTVLYKKNFGRVSVSGPKDSRVCHIEVFRNGGKIKWDYTIPAAELQR